jgi:hypothetical protein
MTVVPIQLTADELELILTKTEIARTKKLRPRLEAMAADGKAIELNVNEWNRILLALCGTRTNEMPICKRSLKTAGRIANDLAEALGIDAPSLRM